jgi:hypothetical protein
MKSILLVLNGGEFQEESIRYSFGLARRLKARLRVLKVFPPMALHGWLKMKNGVQEKLRHFENVMAAAAFAECGEWRETENCLQAASRAACGDSSVDNVDMELRFAVGEVDRETARFVDQNQDIVLAVYEGPRERQRRLLNLVDVPVVSVKRLFEEVRPDEVSNETGLDQ